MRAIWSAVLACGVAGLLLAGCRAAAPSAANQAPVGPMLHTPPQPLNVLVADELGSFGAKLTESISQHNSMLRVDTSTAPLAELAERAKVGIDLVLAIGPNDLVPLDQAGLISPGESTTIGYAPLLFVVPAGHDRPADLAALASGKGKLGVPDKSAGHAAQLAAKAVEAGAPRLATDRVVAAPLADLLARLGRGELAGAVLPAYALIDHQQEVTVKTTLDPAAFELIAVAIKGRPHPSAPQPAIESMRAGIARDLFADTPLVAAKPADEGEASALFVYAGAGIRAPLEAAAKEFSTLTGIPVRYNYTGSACLLAQITMSQEGDLYIPGEDFYMDQAKERGYIKEPQTIAYFVPVIATRKGNPKGIHTLDDLAKPGVRVGLGEPKSCAVGSFTVKLLEKNHLYEQIEHNVTMRTAMAPELGNALKLGAIDACVNWDAVAAWYQDASTIVPIAADQNLVSDITAAVLTFSTQADRAQQYLDFLASDRGKAIFKTQHYTVDPAQPIFPAGHGT